MGTTVVERENVRHTFRAATWRRVFKRKKKCLKSAVEIQSAIRKDAVTFVTRFQSYTFVHTPTSKVALSTEEKWIGNNCRGERNFRSTVREATWIGVLKEKKSP